jgi:hypothetical protein
VADDTDGLDTGRDAADVEADGGDAVADVDAADTAPVDGGDVTDDGGDTAGGDADGGAETDVVDPCSGPAYLVNRTFGSLETLTEEIEDGQTVLLEAGRTTTSERLTLDADDVTIRIERCGVHTLDASGLTSSSPGTDEALMIKGDNVTIDAMPGRLIVERSPAAGITLQETRNTLIRGVTTRHNRASGVRVAGRSLDVRIEYAASYGNFGPIDEERPKMTGARADGFAIRADPRARRQSWPRRVELHRVLAHHNSDNGIDAVRGIEVSVTESIVYASGYGLPTMKEQSNAPGVGILVSRGSSSFYDGNGGPAPTDNQFEKILVWGSGSSGVLFGSGTGHRVVEGRLWANGRKRSANDIDVEEPDSPRVERTIMTSMTREARIPGRDNTIVDESNLPFNRDVDQNMHPADPARFVQSAGGWVEAVLGQERLPRVR